MNKKVLVTAETGREGLLEQVSDLRARLDEAEQTLKAIRHGDVDALVVYGEETPQVYTLEGRDFPYRSIVETMAAGAVTLNQDRIIIYCNAFFSGMVGIPMEQPWAPPFWTSYPPNTGTASSNSSAKPA